MARYHKEEIRQWTGWRPDTTHDAETIQTWVGAHTRVEEATLPHVLAHLTARYKHLKIEVPTAQRLERLAHAVMRTVEDQFFTTLAQALAPEMCQQLDALLTDASPSLSLTALKTAVGRRSLPRLEAAVAQLQSLVLPQELLTPLSPRYLRRIKLRVAAESLHEIRRHPAHIRYALLALFCYVRTQELTDHVIESLLHLVHRMDTHAEKRVDEVLLSDFKRVPGKPRLLYQLAEVSLAQPEGQVKAVIYPAVGEQTLRDVVAEGRASGATYREKVHTVLQSSYRHHYRRLVPQILSVLTLRATNAQHQPMLEALELLRQYAGRKQRFSGAEEEVPLDGVIPRAERSRVVEQTPQGQTRVHRVKYEIAVLQGLRERLRCKEIWGPGAQRYRNPADDLPADFPTQRPTYYQALDKPLAVDPFITDLQSQMTQALQHLDMSLPTNPRVKILQRPRGWIRVSPSEPQPDPPTLAHLKAEVLRRWPTTSLLDVLKETDLRVDFTHYFTGTGTRTALDRASLQRRLLLCLFGLGTNTGLKRVCATMPEDAYHELLYVRRHYLHADALRNAIAHVANAIFRIRAAHIWGEGTTACASDAKHFGAWDQNLLTEWHLRYGGRGVMVYLSEASDK